jgi:hypothetical protein
MSAIQGASIPSVSTDTILYTPTSGYKATVDIAISYQDTTVGNEPALVRLGIMDSDSIGDIETKDYRLKFDEKLYYQRPKGHDKVVVPDGHSIVIFTDKTNVSFGYHGFETEV